VIISILLYTLLTIILLLLVLLLSLLIAPLVININSKVHCYEITLWGFGYVKLVPNKDTLFLEGKIWFWRMQVDTLQFIVKKATEKKVKKAKKKRATSTKVSFEADYKKIFRRIQQVFQSFRIEQLYANIDTGNYAVNAYFYPFYYWLNRRRNIKVNINFFGQNVFIFKAHNRLLFMLIAFLRNK